MYILNNYMYMLFNIININGFVQNCSKIWIYFIENISEYKVEYYRI